ncbi:D-glycero-beta-D-manno-heptose-7-phosphate kinase [Candidatus Igneacidithiobacillus taiwanensis]|uniref:D-glycero-beta-D-manno-heptose-7-phosphate kinase n=1 Tax=Candidatus Igneacidithiobacillus taiwanensis TaxID=1945924 RepID=UPI0028965257|nr:D-glycero-beta-D-manno-heptose-7-phosphate kinase [Candidatus Igneacidithiobacillus taiwanensis]
MPLVVPEALQRLRRARVAVLGDVMLDRYWFGRVERISPEAPVPVVQVGREEQRPGGAANVALNIVALGADCRLRALLGRDAAADALTQLLEQARVETSFRHLDGLPTTVKLRVIGQQQQLLRLDFEERPEEARLAELFVADADFLHGCAALLLSDYGKGVLLDPQPWIQCARAQGLPVLVDPKGRDYTRYRGATLITPNKGEFQAAAGNWRSEEEFRQLGEQQRQAWQVEALLVTRGEEGMTLFLADGIHHHPAQAREVFDVTGAGDTVIATIATAVAAGWPLDRAVELGNRAAGIVVGKLGAATVSPEELSAALELAGVTPA